jgi:SAM-dependent methyltransferase
VLRLNAPLYLFGHRIRVNGWLRDMNVAFRTLVGSTVSDQRLLYYLSNRPDAAAGLEEFRSLMPQAVVVDSTVETLRHEEWRTHFSSRLAGHGVEIGPLNRALPRHANISVAYLDYEDQASLRRRYPALADSIPRIDIVDDAEEVRTVASASFDFLVASHVIEHLRRPIAALREWLRIVRPGGLLYLVAPDKRVTFDRHRVRTTLEHHILDYEEPSAARDFEHYVEFARLVEGARAEAALARARQRHAEGFSIHFHTFIPEDIVELVRWCHAYVSPVTLIEGPALSPEADEFHVLLRKPE